MKDRNDNKDELFESGLVAILKSDMISPLEVIRTSCELLSRGITGKLLPEQLDFITKISKQSQNALALIHNLVDMAKINTGFELNFVNLKIKDMLDNIIQALNKELSPKKIQLSLMANYPNFPFIGDIGRIEKVFKNLLDLCINEAPNGSKIDIDILPLQGQRRSDHKRVIYKISFTFEAPPLSPEEEKLLFDPNIRSLKKPYFLNLPASKQIMLLHKGSLTYEKVSDHASRYSIILPSTVEIPPLTGKEKPTIVLLGEKSKDNTQLTKILSSFNIKTIHETSVDKVFDILKSNKILLIIFDFALNIDAFNKFIKPFNADENFQGISILLFSKKEKQRSLVAIDRYISDIISKPIETKELKTKLENYIITPSTSQEKDNKKMVLVVEDNPNFRKEIQSYLSDDYSLTICKNGSEALFFLKKYNFACAIFDAEMHEMDGIELIIKTRQINKTMPVVFSTERYNEIYQRGASIFGVSRVLKKPFTKEMLLETITEVTGS